MRRRDLTSWRHLAKLADTAESPSGFGPVQSGDSGAAAARAMVRGTWPAIAHNAAAIAWRHWQPEHVHRLRVALRRMRTALRLARECAMTLNPSWEISLAQAFRLLGASRDRDALLAWLPPALHAAGLEMPALPAGDAPASPQSVVRQAAFRSTLLDLHRFSQGDNNATSVPNFAAEAEQYLKRLHERTQRDAGRFAALSTAKQHVVRKRIKRLRYAAEYCAGLAPQKQVLQFLKSVQAAQEALGLLQDTQVALAALAPLAAHDEQAARAVAWLSVQGRQAVQRCARALRRVGAPPALDR
jgi:triphosphatase